MLAVFDRQAESLMVFYEEKTGDLFSSIFLLLLRRIL